MAHEYWTYCIGILHKKAEKFFIRLPTRLERETKSV